jgi:hypothetical protein
MQKIRTAILDDYQNVTLSLVDWSRVSGDVLRPDEKSASRGILAELFAWREDLRLKERADAARSTLPPQKSHYRIILFPCCSR